MRQLSKDLACYFFRDSEFARVRAKCLVTVRLLGYTETRLRRIRASKRAAGFECPDQMSVVAELLAPRNFGNFYIYLHTFHMSRVRLYPDGRVQYVCNQ